MANVIQPQHYHAEYKCYIILSGRAFFGRIVEVEKAIKEGRVGERERKKKAKDGIKVYTERMR